MKRSTQVSLVLMGAVGVGGAAGYALGEYCRQSPPNTVAGDQPQPQPSTVASNQQQPACRSSGGRGWGFGSSGRHGWGFGHGWGSRASFFSGFGASNSNTVGASSSASVASGLRGGFGSIGAMLGGARG
jgi:hypothetical protein